MSTDEGEIVFPYLDVDLSCDRALSVRGAGLPPVEDSCSRGDISERVLADASDFTGAVPVESDDPQVHVLGGLHGLSSRSYLEALLFVIAYFGDDADRGLLAVPEACDARSGRNDGGEDQEDCPDEGQEWLDPGFPRLLQ